MKLLEQIQRINRLHELIQHRRTGTPQELAQRLNLSTSMVYKVMEELKQQDVPLEYSRDLRSYYYSQPYIMSISVNFGLVADRQDI